jgi:hypothetical protein
LSNISQDDIEILHSLLAKYLASPLKSFFYNSLYLKCKLIYTNQMRKEREKCNFRRALYPLEKGVGAKWIAESAQRARKLLATRENNGWVI